LETHHKGTQLGIHPDRLIVFCAQVYMKTTQDIVYGFIIFFIIDRTSRLISAYLSTRRDLSDIETETMRCSIELFMLLVALLIIHKFI